MSTENILSKKWYHFLSPRYWPTWIAIAFLRLSAFLPYPILLLLGKNIGRLIMSVWHERRTITAINLKLCFPQLNNKEHENLLRRSFESMGIGLFETGLAWWGSDKRLKKMARLDPNNLITAKKSDKGILGVTGHFTHIEMNIRLLSLYTPVSGMYRPQKNKLFEWTLQKCRARYVQERIHRKNIRGMLRTIRKNNSVVIYTPDQDLGYSGTVFAPFFGITASTVTGGNYFVKKTGCAVLPVFWHRNEALSCYESYFLPPLENFPSNDNLADATRMNKIIEGAILKAPEQYMWQHRRFKTRPDGEAGVYLKYSYQVRPPLIS